jgi:hypothetical protein
VKGDALRRRLNGVQIVDESRTEINSHSWSIWSVLVRAIALSIPTHKFECPFHH